MNQLAEFAVTIGTAPRSDAQPCYAEPQASIAGIEDIVLVASGKGGVGKSTVTVNLACAMARAGQRVGILDADLYGPSITRMMGSDCGLPTDAEGRTMPVESHGVWALSVANVLPPEAALAWKGPLVTQALLQMFHDIAWPELDILLVDLPPGTGDVPLTILEQIPVTGAVLVTTPQKLSVVDAARGIAMFHDLDIPVFGLVENMSSYICPCCGEQQPIFPDGAARALARRRHVRFLGEIPLDPEGQLLADGGTPLVMSRPEGAVANSFVALAAEMVVAVEKERTFRKRNKDTDLSEEQKMFWENLLDDDARGEV